MTPSFNLVDEPWIPCIDTHGTVVHLGVFEALSRAHEFKELRDESPLVTVTLHRLLLAVLHRVVDGPKTPAEWQRLWQAGAGRFDPAKLEAYLRRADIYPRFDLFDPTHPFYQTGNLPLGEPDKKNDGRPKFVKPIWQMAHELAYSDSMNLFAHYTEGDWQTRPAAEAARWLVAFQAFALGGLITTEEGKKTQDGSADAGHLVKSAVVLARGETLFQTLALNLVHYSIDDEEPFAFKAKEERAAWESNAPVQPADRPFRGYLDLLTWQSRRVKLVPDVHVDGELLGVCGVVAMKGWQLPGFDSFNRETMVAFQVPKDRRAPSPFGFRVSKALWRDGHALLRHAAESSPPKTLLWIADLKDSGRVDLGAFRLEVYGMASSQAKVHLWRHESLSIPLEFLRRSEVVAGLKRAVRFAEKVARILNIATYAAVIQVKKNSKPTMQQEAAHGLDFTTTNDRMKKKRPDPIGNRVKSLAPDRSYWSQLEIYFHQLLPRIAASADVESIEREIAWWFDDILAPFAREGFASVARSMSGSQRELHGVAMAENILERRLRKLGKSIHRPTQSELEETNDG